MFRSFHLKYWKKKNSFQELPVICLIGKCNINMSYHYSISFPGFTKYTLITVHKFIYLLYFCSLCRTCIYSFCLLCQTTFFGYIPSFLIFFFSVSEYIHEFYIRATNILTFLLKCSYKMDRAAYSRKKAQKNYNVNHLGIIHLTNWFLCALKNMVASLFIGTFSLF